ncbi:hypothetical protein M406DRAFT_322812 [Cryphonectria parasitica EP155]|uniref:Uncharacterized protein n=1 Tax=Cryphonectria parasitica (strain ATCC 38755 / EP155) TaxID=660469 RepID=A0A9P5CN09_CRYP1|nr:uncharacterized protein M406DRAFT_322812 [Cryphonectria parasitica EP155]KAF3764959.1 hypothetical protein M406DRAFT_322812 [Cryphonectria parasitica EP155]
MGGGGQQYASSGRGGAGNFIDSTKSPKLQPQDLQTPTLKTGMVTTGRGGSGNMALNKDPAETRARQDVEPVARRESQGAQHSGRGGAGNVFKGEDAEQAKKAANTNAITDEKDEHKGLAAKGKALLGIGKKD